MTCADFGLILGMCLAAPNCSHDIGFIDDSRTTNNSPQIEKSIAIAEVSGTLLSGMDHPIPREMSL
jgi:hypothetical protein